MKKVSRVRVSLLVVLAICLAVAPASAKTKHRTYTFSKTYAISNAALQWNPGKDSGNPADSSNPANDVRQEDPGLDPASTVMHSLDGTPVDKYFLRGTPADKNFLVGTPADAETGGVKFTTFTGTPMRLKITDSQGAKVPWVANQCLKSSQCGQPGDPSAKGCGTPPGGARLPGFMPKHELVVFVLTSDVAPLFVDSECDGPATTGTVVLTTTT